MGRTKHKPIINTGGPSGARNKNNVMGADGKLIGKVVESGHANGNQGKAPTNRRKLKRGTKGPF
jgi:hypothetical protein